MSMKTIATAIDSVKKTDSHDEAKTRPLPQQWCNSTSKSERASYCQTQIFNYIE